ncbi:ComF family protein [Ancylobacter amanitiformis]|uniref:ComF family protein n=1 Tax=Ancylobacter amanitiformis TaxID=217069 RepID=A0ABU0LP37_9HYPH|nr:ComF family protein [Ancylobacter amanitiformis]MDQ0510469.1 ComF family protein [Ancylobacter amanitiformis]
MDNPLAPERHRTLGLRRPGLRAGRWLGMGRMWARGLVDLALPPVCMACRAAVGEPGCLCAPCWSRMRFIERPYCDRLGIPLTHEYRTFGPAGPVVSEAAFAHPPAYGRARAVATFGDVSRDMIHALKYADRLDIAAPMARMMARAGEDILADAGALVPVPLHPLRLWKRRFNQSMLLARGVAGVSGVPVRAGWLRRARATTPQVGLDRSARAQNVAGAFTVPEAMRAEVRGRRLVLVDDVLTTGATIDACAKALMRAGAQRVDVLVFARVVDGRDTPIS